MNTENFVIAVNHPCIASLATMDGCNMGVISRAKARMTPQ